MRDLLPRPTAVHPAPGEFVFTSATGLSGPDDLTAPIRSALSVVPLAPNGTGIEVERDPALQAEAYTLSVTPERIRITAADRCGAFYAAQTLRQLLPDAVWRAAVPAGTRWAVPCGVVEDEPRFSWRGAHLDISRHFMPKREVLRMIDLLAMHKMNRLHLHLTDDQGWRVESHRFPLLHVIGSHRTESMISHYEEDASYDSTPHGGYYTLNDLAEIGAYAEARAITIVPEIDVPGHAAAILAAYPELGSRHDTTYQVLGKWGISRAILSPLPATVDFLTEVFAEILAAVKTPYFHLGGDECVLDDWEANPEIEEYRRSLGLGSMGELHAHFLRELGDRLAEHGCRAVYWDEAYVSGRLRDDSLIMAWRGMQVARRAASAGYDVIATPVVPTYFDYAEVDDANEPLAIGGPITLDDVASFEPAPADWPEEASAHLVGTQFQLWTERIPDGRTLDYRAWPRGCALAEVAWSGSADAEFTGRLTGHLARLDAYGVEYRPLTGPHPWQSGGTGPRRHRPGRIVAADVMTRLDGMTLDAASTRPSM
ncbi:beta-N-acetylhexosaminidase [Rhizohabitans arisaemae]|uniref:beta-N-acetylhexosaminidase n=1 Tax=Rhizohabitans arisaemae TaxID=2720610 RepID=UPI0024B27B8C|nr:beta-N-acetylhexosaminidase [Rhizohabitans arisaemae]